MAMADAARQGVTVVLDERVAYEPPPLHVPTLDELAIDAAPKLHAKDGASLRPVVAELPRETRQQRRARERDARKRSAKKGGWPR